MLKIHLHKVTDSHAYALTTYARVSAQKTTLIKITISQFNHHTSRL